MRLIKIYSSGRSGTGDATGFSSFLPLISLIFAPLCQIGLHADVAPFLTNFTVSEVKNIIQVRSRLEYDMFDCFD